MLGEGAPDTGNHKVILSWNASKQSPNTGEIGYCLYRSDGKPIEATQGETLQKPPCVKCQRVNIDPVAETGCVDNIVKNGAHYFYAVMAVEAGNARRSVLSTQVDVQIPRGKEPVNPSLSTAYPLCQADTQKPAPSGKPRSPQ